MNQYLSDSPVDKPEDDHFSRWSFAQRIAQVISSRRDPNCLTIGLYGEWGSGKTSVLNFIEKELELDENVICVKFNPWRFTTEDALLHNFFFTIANSLDYKLKTKKDTFKNLAKKILPGTSNLFRFKGVGDVISSFISLPDLKDFRQRLEQTLNEKKKRVLVIIDDVDRLDKEEIYLLFKLIRLSADFKYTAYLLALDKNIFAASLQDKYSNSTNNAGESFLEKIIQVPIHLPLIEKRVLRNFCFNGVEEALKIAEIQMDEDQEKIFVKYFDSAFDNHLKSPRKVNLYSNTLLFSLPILKGEVNPVDVLLIEALRVFCPFLYEGIRDRKDLFVDIYLFSKDEINKKLRNYINNLFAQNNQNITEGLSELLCFLFPNVQSIYSNSDMKYNLVYLKKSEQRVCQDNYFEKLFTYSISNTDISDIQLNHFLDSLEESNIPNNSINIFENELVNENNIESLISKLSFKTKSISSSASINLVGILAENCRKYPKQKNSFGYSCFTQAAILIKDLFESIEVQDHVEVAIKCINLSEDVNFKVNFFRYLKLKDDRNEIFSDATIEKTGDYLGRVLKEILANKSDLDGLDSLPAILSILNNYEQCFLNSYLQKILDEDKNNIITLLVAYAGKEYILGNSKEFISDFERNEYNSFTNVIEPIVFLEAVEKHYGETLEFTNKYSRNDFVRNFEGDNKENTLRQFISVHQNVMAEATPVGEIIDSFFSSRDNISLYLYKLLKY